MCKKRLQTYIDRKLKTHHHSEKWVVCYEGVKAQITDSFIENSNEKMEIVLISTWRGLVEKYISKQKSCISFRASEEEETDTHQKKKGL